MTGEKNVHPVQHATHAYVGAFVEQLALAGLRHVVLCPGSRSTPLALLLADQNDMKIWTHVDERSAGFFALGLAKATEEPVALVATSGTAVANFLPAVTEAFFGRVPLLLLTADRPPELRDVGSNQTVFQAGIFGSHVKWSVDMPVPEQTDTLVAYARAVAARAFAKAKAAPRGPIQLNFPLREPLIPLAAPARQEEGPERGREKYDRYALAGRAPTTKEPIGVRSGRAVLPKEDVTSLADELATTRRLLIVAGPDTPPESRTVLLDLADRLGAPVLADPLSGLRTAGRLTDRLIDAYDVFLRFERVRHAVPPSYVLRFGALPVSKPLQQYLQSCGDVPHIVVDEGGGWRDPMGVASRVLHVDGERLCRDVLGALEEGPPPRANPWPLVWRRLNDIAREQIEEELSGLKAPFEGRVFDILARMPLEGVNLYVGNSMPIRDMDAFFPGVEGRVNVFGNRGVSGIDGLVSGALGVAASGTGPTLLVLGDLSFYHDLNGLLAASMHGLDLTVVVIHNDGGGIFSFLPQAEHGRHFERLFATPTGLDFGPVVEMYGGRFLRTSDGERLQEGMAEGLKRPGLHVVEYVTDRRKNASCHRAMMAEVGRRLEDELSAVFRSAAGNR